MLHALKIMQYIHGSLIASFMNIPSPPPPHPFSIFCINFRPEACERRYAAQQARVHCYENTVT